MLLKGGIPIRAITLCLYLHSPSSTYPRSLKEFQKLRRSLARMWASWMSRKISSTAGTWAWTPTNNTKSASCKNMLNWDKNMTISNKNTKGRRPKVSVVSVNKMMAKWPHSIITVKKNSSLKIYRGVWSTLPSNWTETILVWGQSWRKVKLLTIQSN